MLEQDTNTHGLDTRELRPYFELRAAKLSAAVTSVQEKAEAGLHGNVMLIGTPKGPGELDLTSVPSSQRVEMTGRVLRARINRAAEISGRVEGVTIPKLQDGLTKIKQLLGDLRTFDEICQSRFVTPEEIELAADSIKELIRQTVGKPITLDKIPGYRSSLASLEAEKARLLAENAQLTRNLTKQVTHAHPTRLAAITALLAGDAEDAVHNCGLTKQGRPHTLQQAGIALLNATSELEKGALKGELITEETAIYQRLQQFSGPGELRGLGGFKEWINQTYLAKHLPGQVDTPAEGPKERAVQLTRKEWVILCSLIKTRFNCFIKVGQDRLQFIMDRDSKKAMNHLQANQRITDSEEDLLKLRQEILEKLEVMLATDLSDMESVSGNQEQQDMDYLLGDLVEWNNRMGGRLVDFLRLAPTAVPLVDTENRKLVNYSLISPVTVDSRSVLMPNLN